MGDFREDKETPKRESDWLSLSRKNVMSQSGEDGVTGKIFDVIGETNKWCVEFGAGDGKLYSNTYNLLVNRGWSGVQIEADARKFEALTRTHKGNARVICLNASVSFECADAPENILLRTPVPKNFDLLSIDIDGNDYHIWDSLRRYTPRVVIVAFNHTIPPDIEFVQPKDMRVSQGSSVLSLTMLAGVFARVVDHCRKLVRLRSETKAGTQLKAAVIVQPANVRSLAKTVNFILEDLQFDKVLVQPRHVYSRVTLRNYRRQARAANYSEQEKEALLRAAALTFKMASEDPRIIPTRGTLRQWLDFYANPLGIRKICESSALIFVDAYGNLRGCLSGVALGNIRDTSMTRFLRSKQYRRFLRFARICNICVHGYS